MPNEKTNQPESFSGLVQEMLKKRYPMTEDIWEGLRQMGFEPSCGAAVALGLIQKGVKGDVNAAKLIRDINGEGTDIEEGFENGFAGMTDAELVRMIRAAGSGL